MSTTMHEAAITWLTNKENKARTKRGKQVAGSPAWEAANKTKQMAAYCLRVLRDCTPTEPTND